MTEQFVQTRRRMPMPGWFRHDRGCISHTVTCCRVFISPVTNQRDDDYGGDIEARMRFSACEVVRRRTRGLAGRQATVRNAYPQPTGSKMALSREQDMLAAARLLKDAGVDIINVSTGQVTKDEDPIYGRMFQAPFADQIQERSRYRDDRRR